MIHSSRRHLAAAAAAALVTPGICGCQAKLPPPRPRAHLLIGFDASGSARDRLPILVRKGARLVRRFQPDYDRVTIYRLDYHAVELLDGTIPRTIEAVETLLFQELKDPQKTAGTRPAEFWREAARRATASPDLVVVVLCTDGHNDTGGHPHSAAALREAASRLAKCDRLVGAILWGTEAGSRETLRRDFKPLGERLILRSTLDAEVDEVVDLVRHGVQR